MNGQDKYGRPSLNGLVVDVHRTRISQWFRKWVSGSAFAASLWEFLLWYVIGVGWFLFFVYAIEPAYPTLFPVADTFTIGIFFIITFGGPLFISVESDLYRSYISDFTSALGNIETLAYEVTGFIPSTDADVSGWWRYTRTGDILQQKIKLRDVLLELNMIIRSICIAEWLEHRSLSRRENRSVDESDIKSELDPGMLPMYEHLKNELNTYRVNDSTSGLADQLFNMLFSRLATLHESDSKLYKSVFLQSTDRQISGITTSTAAIVANKMNSATPIVIGFTRVVLWIWCLGIPWIIWGEYRWFSLLVLPIVVWPFLAMYHAARKLEDPFVPYEFTPFNWNSMGKIAVGAASNVDKIFDRKYERMALADPMSGLASNRRIFG